MLGQQGVGKSSIANSLLGNIPSYISYDVFMSGAHTEIIKKFLEKGGPGD